MGMQLTLVYSGNKYVRLAVPQCEGKISFVVSSGGSEKSHFSA